MAESTAVIGIEGMTCGHCAASVKKALEAVPGVKGATVNLEEKQARVELGEPGPEMGVLMRAVTGAGFRATGFSRAS